MKDYRSIEEKLVFSHRMEEVYWAIRSRVKPNRLREDTNTSPVSTDGKDPFRDVFCEMPEKPYVIKEAIAIVRSWLVTPVVIFPGEALVGITRPRYPNIEHFHWGVMTDGLREEIVGAEGAEKVGVSWRCPRGSENATRQSEHPKGRLLEDELGSRTQRTQAWQYPS